MRTAIPRASRSPMQRWPRSPSSVTRFTASGTTPSHPTSRNLEAVIPRHTLKAVQERVVGIMRKLGGNFEPGEGHQHCTAAVRDESGAVLFRARLALDLD